MIPLRKTPSKVPAPPFDATPAPPKGRERERPETEAHPDPRRARMRVSEAR